MGVTLCCSLLKKTVLKKCAKKVYAFLPFLLGLIVYAAYRAILTLSAEPFTGGLTDTFEGGFACGCVATLYYVVYEQFFRTTPPAASTQTPAVSPVTPLLQGVVPEEKVEQAAKDICEGSKDKTGDELFCFVLKTLRAYTSENGAVSEAELMLYAKTLSQFLISVSL